MSRRLAVRLPLLLALGLGLWLWQSGLFPQPRELLLRLPSRGPPVTRAELQLYAEGGELLKREERSFPGGGAPDELRVEIALKRGRYLCRLFVEDASGGKRQLSRTVEVREERTYELEPDAR